MTWLRYNGKVILRQLLQRQKKEASRFSMTSGSTGEPAALQ